MKTAAHSLILVTRRADGSLKTQPLEGFATILAEASADYAIVLERTGKAPEDLRVARQGDDLLIEKDDEPALAIEDFYATPDCGFVPEATLVDGSLAGASLDAGSPVIKEDGGDQVIWEASQDGGGAAPLLWGGGALAALGIVAMSSGSGSSSAPPPEPPSPEPAVVNTVTGTIVAGPVVAGNGLSVAIFQADGTTLLGTAKVAADGTFTLEVGDYAGVVIARVVDAGDGDDYEDEATGAGKDLNAQLSAMEVIDAPNTTVVMNINALTTLASELGLRSAGSASITAATVNANNQAIADLFGLPSLHGIEVEATNSGGFDGADGLSPEEHYGAVLASFSGADQLNGGDSQQTLDQVLEGLSVDDEGNASLTEESQATIVEGAEHYEETEGGVDSGGVSVVVDTYAPKFQSSSQAAALAENSGPGLVVYTASATDAGRVEYELKDADDHAAFSIDASTGAVTLTGNPDHESKSSYAFTVVATDAAGNSSEQAVTLAITDRDDTAPTVTSGALAAAIDENSGESQVVYTAVADDSADVSGGVAFSLKAVGDHAAFSINSSTGAVTLTGNPDHESKSSYAFTVVATDAAGNSSEQSVALAIDDLDEAAPSITSGGAPTAIDENSGASQVVYTAVADDSADVSGGVTFSLKAADDHAAFSIDANTGAVTLTGDPNHETKASYAFTVVAADAAGNSSEQAVSLAINDLDEAAPGVTSGGAASAIDENSGASQVVYTAVADDSADVSGGVAFTLKAVADHAAFSIDSNTGAVTLAGDPDHETKASYAFTVVATDAAGNSSEQAVTLAINDLDDTAPTVTSGALAAAIDENSGESQVVYTATADDSADVTGGLSFSLKAVGDHAAFSIDSSTGPVTLTGNPNHETKSSYAFTVVATDAAGNSSEQSVALAIDDLDEAAPSITSGGAPTAIDENSGASQVVYTAVADDSADVSGGVTFSLKAADDHAAFSIDADTGAVTLAGDPDHESKSSYAFTVVATDAAGNSSEQAVTLAINDLDEAAPSITSGGAATAIDENSGASQVVYTAVADDSADVSGGVAFSLKAVDDHAAFSIDSSTGAVTLEGDPNHETKSSYAFTVVATDDAGNSSEQAVALAINDLDETAPSITSGGAPTAIDENSGASQVVYTAVADDSADVSGGVTFTLKAVDDHAAFSIDSSTGAVTLTGDPDHETTSSYAFTVVATDAAGNSSEQAVALAINDLDEAAPSITSGGAPTAIDENSGASQVVYTAVADDTADVSEGVTFSLKAVDDHAAFSIDSSTGAVTLTGDPNHETKGSYAFTVVATDAAGHSSEQAVALAINDLDEAAPSISTGATASAIDENSGASQVIYTVVADDSADVSGGVTFTLKAVDDHAAFSINASTGAVTLTGDPDHETKSNHAFTVVATDAAGNSSEQAVILPINDLDEAAPSITSGGAASAITENSGASQVVYTAVADDTADVSDGVTFSLKAVDDHAAFSIDSSTGAVTLTGDPDYETKSSYSFTVVATDAAENSSEQAVSLAINDIADETAPTIESIAIASATGIQNSALNAGDVVSVTVTMSENTTVDTTDGTPRLALTIGGAAVYASYASGSETASLVFTYTILAAQTDANGISIPADALDLNGGEMRDATGNAAVVTHLSVGDNAGFLVDTASPTAEIVAEFETVSLPLDFVGSQSGSAHQIAALGTDGAFVMAWTGTNSDFMTDIYIQRFDTNGAPVGQPALVERAGALFQSGYVPHIAALGNDGAFALTWEAADDDGDKSIFVQRFDTAGNAAGALVLLEPDGVTNQADVSPRIAALGSNGAFAVTWYGQDGGDNSVFMQRFASDGSAVGIPIIIEPDGVTEGEDYYPQIASIGSDGAFAVAWQGGDGSDDSIFVQRFDSDGLKDGPTVLIEPDGITNDFEEFPQIVALGDGGAFAVAWHGSDGQNTSIFVQRFDASGSKVGSPILAENGTGDFDRHPEITALGNGGAFAVTWFSSLGSGVYAIGVRSFDDNGDPTGPTVYLEASNSGSRPQISQIGDDGAFAIVWHAQDTDGDDSVFLQAFAADGTKLTLEPTKLEAPGVPDGWDIHPNISAIGNDGSFVVAWAGTDAQGNPITHVQRFNADGTTTRSDLITSSESIVVQSSEAGSAFLVNESVVVGSLGDITDVADNLWNTVAVGAANSSTAIAALGLVDGSYKLYTVDAAGNLSAASEQTIVIDSTGPSFTSGAAATAILENSGAGQVVYTAEASDAHATTFSLKAADDHAAFSIDAATGAVTLTGDPDHETKASYAFTVVATDAAGNASEQAVSLAIDDVADETAPTVESIAVTSATGIQSSRLNAGDVVSVTVTMSESTTVDTTDGTPRLALTIGAATVYASYASGSETGSLVFTYTILAAQTDANGISIAADALDLNGGEMRDAAGNAAVVTHLSLGDNAGFLVDTTAPTFSSSTPADEASSVAISSNIVLNFSENVVAGSGNITISDGDGDARVIAATDGTQVSISGSQVTINPTADLLEGASYHVQVASGALTDAAGNAFAGIADTTTVNFGTAGGTSAAVVVFDLVEGVSSSHSGRAFQADTSYTIYIRVNSASSALSTDGVGPGASDTWGQWTGGANLGSDDRVVLVGTGSHVLSGTTGGGTGPATWLYTDPNRMLWMGPTTAARLSNHGYFSRKVTSNDYTSADLWSGNWAQNPNLGSNGVFDGTAVYRTDMPAGVLTSQGLA